MEIMPQFRVGRYAGNFGSENMPAISGRKKNVSNVGSEQNVGKFGPVFLGGDKIAGKPAITGELTGLTDL